jgi:hypothetical protein
VAQCPHERRSGARGEALWAPMGDQCTGGHAAGLSLATRRWHSRTGIGSKPQPSAQRLMRGGEPWRRAPPRLHYQQRIYRADVLFPGDFFRNTSYRFVLAEQSSSGLATAAEPNCKGARL